LPDSTNEKLEHIWGSRPCRVFFFDETPAGIIFSQKCAGKWRRVAMTVGKSEFLLPEGIPLEAEEAALKKMLRIETI